ncbi:LacI family repressor for deo operon, udp, cdd, tsx, nupC, and nupG [Caldalkalibacillus uzonensis]|uniref:LacI family repressor for deo operon, udp, cdd, tsx, nupC, and nupG n=1 Tax=Caldalkalibacillus uzonensis TaxID=353224 RepID=A0ABU0CQX1_9BACI|nr:LacI family DNA-binding transcriptional regulator [Caldalkalibacillus uzonensis]MDQ0338812.1 LacI family repressor for deo operon, udp, cdd, tsx, nupC, and nupG [Caldalkalibacillus uzonensis]
MATIHDVAKLAKVSIATVSRVLSHPEKVSPKTRQLVVEAMNQLDYRPNSMAQNLRRLQSNIIIALMPDIKNPFFSEVFRGIEDRAREAGFKILVGSTDRNKEKEKEYINLLKESWADGVILTTAEIDRRFIDELAQRRPLVLACEYIPGSPYPSVSIDNESAARKITKHLILQGHKRVAHIAGPSSIILSVARLTGYLQALHQSGLIEDEALIQEGDFTLQSGYDLANKLLSLKNPPTAIFAANDEMAIGAMKAIQDKGIRVPEDVAVAGFDDINVASFVTPSLTTIRQPRYKIGQTSVDLLLKVINHEPLDQPQIVLEDELIVRHSTTLNPELVM